jgi:hypothetical protein
VNRLNFRADVSANGVINKGDRTLVRANVGRTVGP